MKLRVKKAERALIVHIKGRCNWIAPQAACPGGEEPEAFEGVSRPSWGTSGSCSRPVPAALPKRGRCSGELGCLVRPEPRTSHSCVGAVLDGFPAQQHSRLSLPLPPRLQRLPSVEESACATGFVSSGSCAAVGRATRMFWPSTIPPGASPGAPCRANGNNMSGVHKGGIRRRVFKGRRGGGTEVGGVQEKCHH